MAKSLFQSANASIKKKRTFMISQDLVSKLEQIEMMAEKQGISFPLNEHVEASIRRLLLAAEKELQCFDTGLSNQSDDSEVNQGATDDSMSSDVDGFSK